MFKSFNVLSCLSNIKDNSITFNFNKLLLKPIKSIKTTYCFIHFFINKLNSVSLSTNTVKINTKI